MIRDLLLSLPKSLYYSCLCCGIRQGIHFPIRIHYKTDVKGLNSRTFFYPKTRDFKFSFGFGGSEGVPFHSRQSLIIKGDSKMVVGNNVSFGRGSVIRIDDGAILKFGDSVHGNKNNEIYCSTGIDIGSDVIFGWDVMIRDSDGHTVFVDGRELLNKKMVKIGHHVWIGAHVDVLKGTSVPDESIVGYRSCVMGKFYDSNILIAGYPAGILRRNIKWEK